MAEEFILPMFFIIISGAPLGKFSRLSVLKQWFPFSGYPSSLLLSQYLLNGVQDRII